MLVVNNIFLEVSKNFFNNLFNIQCNCKNILTKVTFSSVAQSCPTLCDPMNHSTPGLPGSCPSPTPGVYSNSCSSSR